MDIQSTCRNYFNAFQELASFRNNSAGTNVVAALKLLSYFTVVIPLGFAVTYGLSSLIGRVKIKENPSPVDISTNNQAKTAILKQPLPSTNPSSTPSSPIKNSSSSFTGPTSLKKLDKALTDQKEIGDAFKNVNSSNLMPLTGIQDRNDFMANFKQGKEKLKPVVLSQSTFVSKQMTEHLMKNKKDSAIAVKYMGSNQDKITNMEGALHTFLTPITPITMTGDYAYKGGHSIIQFQDKGRPVILSAAVQPDFELGGSSEVVMKLVEVKNEPLLGKPLSSNFEPLWDQTKGDSVQFKQKYGQYEEELQQHMVYHLTTEHRLPALSEVKDAVISYEKSITLIEGLIAKQDDSLDLVAALKDQYVQLNGHVISLEALFNIYIHQVCNEFSVLEQTLPQGYVYTIDPPAIFTTQIGGVAKVNLLNRLQILAFKHLKKNSDFANLRTIGFNDFADKGAINLFKQVFPDKNVVSKQSLFSEGNYSDKNPYALVLHNNSDAFGQNIETEGPTSMDGIIGCYSDAACQLYRQRPDLMKHVV